MLHYLIKERYNREILLSALGYPLAMSSGMPARIDPNWEWPAKFCLSNLFSPKRGAVDDYCGSVTFSVKRGKMRIYAIKRLLLIVPTLLLVTVIVFLFLRLMPGNVIDLMVEEMVRGGSDVQEIDRAAIERMMGLKEFIILRSIFYL